MLRTTPDRRSCFSLLVAALLGCSTPASDCPPAPELQVHGASESSEPEPTAEPTPTQLGAPTPLTVTADDGHELRLWALLPSTQQDDRRAIVLVHGRTWSSLPDFDLRVGDDVSLSLMHTLASGGIATYAVDLRGYGGTARDASGWLEPERAAADLFAALEFVKQQEGEAPDLLGWSMGALVAHLTVQQHADAARSLTLYGYPRDLDKRGGPESTPAEPIKQANTEDAARSDFITKDSISEAAIAAYVAASLAADPVRVDWRAMHQFEALSAAEIPVRTLIIYGVHDPIAKQLWQAKLFTRLTVEDRQWVVIPDADHAAHLERPELFVGALLSFLG